MRDSPVSIDVPFGVQNEDARYEVCGDVGRKHVDGENLGCD